MFHRCYKILMVLLLSLSGYVAYSSAAGLSNVLHVLHEITAKGSGSAVSTSPTYAVAITAPVAHVFVRFLMANGACAEYQLDATYLGQVNAAIQKGIALTVSTSVTANATVATQWDVAIIVSDTKGSLVAQQQFTNVVNSCKSVTGLAQNAVITSSTNPFTGMIYDIVLTDPSNLNLSYAGVPLNSTLGLIPVTLPTIIPVPTSISDLPVGQSISELSVILGTATGMLYGAVSLDGERLWFVNNALTTGGNFKIGTIVQANPINSANQDVVVIIYDLNDTVIISQMFQNVVNAASVANAANVAIGAPITSATPFIYYNADITFTGNSKPLQLGANMNQTIALRTQTAAPAEANSLKTQAPFLASLNSAGMTVSTAATLVQAATLPSWTVSINGAWQYPFVSSGTVAQGSIDLTKIVGALTTAQMNAGISTIMLAVDATGTIIADITKTAPASWALYMFDATGKALPNTPVTVAATQGLAVTNSKQSPTNVYSGGGISFAINNAPSISGTYPLMLTLQTTQTSLLTQPIYLNASLQAFNTQAWIGSVAYLWSEFALQSKTIAAINTAVTSGTSAILNIAIVPNANTGFYDATFMLINSAQSILAVETYPSIINASSATLPAGKYPLNKPYLYTDSATNTTIPFATTANISYQLAGQNIVGVNGVPYSSITMFMFMPAQV